MRKPIIFLLIAYMLIGCGPNQQKKDINEISAVYSNFPKSQKKIATAYKLNIDECDAAPDANTKQAIQVKFNKWIEKYVLDTLKGNIRNWVVIVDYNDTSSYVSYKKFNYISAQFSVPLFKGFHKYTHWGLYQQSDYSPKDNLNNNSFYNKVKNLIRGKQAKLNGKVISFDFKINNLYLDMPEYNLVVDSVYQ